MVEEYESDIMSVRYIKEKNSLYLEWNGGEDAEAEDYRTLLMHSSELIRRYECETIIVNGNSIKSVCETDIKWSRKVLLPTLLEAGLKRVIFVGKFEAFDIDKLDGKLVVAEAADLDAALNMIHNEDKPSADVASMTKAEAIAYLGLAPDANAYAIDEKFWQLSKRYRGESGVEAEQKLIDLSCAYDIACGRRDAIRQASQSRASERKLFGKTAGEWKTYFSYTWLRWLVIAVAAVCAFLLVKQIWFTPRYDCSVVSFGHFDFDNTSITAALSSEGYTNPYVTSVDIVVPNDEGESDNAYSDQTFAAVMSSAPDLIITDEQTYGYYYSYLNDISTVYDDLKDFVSPDIYDAIEPIYMSEREAVALSNSYIEDNIIDKDVEDITQYSDSPVMVGLEITDPDIIARLGYTNLWPSSKATLVLGMYKDTEDVAACEKVMIAVLNGAT